MEAAVRKELQVQLQSLRPVLLAGPDRSFPNLFDEFVPQREFELALHVVCDFILHQILRKSANRFSIRFGTCSQP
jgi:hypothetical protein